MQNKELKLYLFDPRPDEFQAERRAVLQKIFDARGYWSITEWSNDKNNPSLWLTVKLKKPIDRNPELTPAIAYIVEKLANYNLDRDLTDAIGTLLLQLFHEQKGGKILDVTITLPGGKMLNSTAGEMAGITLDYKYNVRHDASTDQIILLSKLQAFEYYPDLRIKFASINETGAYMGDSNEEYDSLFDELPPGWDFNKQAFQVQTRAGNLHRAWRLIYDNRDVLVVEHETGVEIILKILVDVGIGLFTSGVYDLIKSALGSWIAKRKSMAAKGIPKAPTFLEMERSTRDKDGNILSTETLRIREPVRDEILQQILDRFMKKDA